MANSTGIEWTDATWNPTTGCTEVSAGCDNCYAKTLAHRLLKRHYLGQSPVVPSSSNRSDPFAVRVWLNRLDAPESWREPRYVFVNSMSDLFHKDIPIDFLRACFNTMLRVDRHAYQILTKRPASAARIIDGPLRDLIPDGLPQHIWIGTSVENQDVACRVRHLLAVRARVRFLSCEPLIGPLRLGGTGFESGVHWAIVGGESGPKRRPLKQEWVRSLRDECLAADVPFFFKQWGGRTPKANGRELDGQEWDQMPSHAA